MSRFQNDAQTFNIVTKAFLTAYPWDVIDAAVAAGFTGSKPGSDEAYLKVEQVEQAETEASKELTEEQVEENTRHEQSEAGVESKDTAVPTGSTTEDSADKDAHGSFMLRRAFALSNSEDAACPPCCFLRSASLYRTLRLPYCF
eukprot:5624370-Amphidinium_carterae.2